jgi:phage FluMu protein Com
MPISFECSGCGATLKVKEQYSGRRIKCPRCETANQVPAESEESVDEDEVVSRTPLSSAASRSKQTRRNELPQPLKRKKKKPSRKSKSGSDDKVPVWALVAGSVAGFLSITVIVFIVMKPRAQAANGQVAVGDQAEQAKVVQAHVDGPGAKFRVKFEMPVKWKSEGSIEDEMFPWATMEGEGQSIKLSSNKSLLGGVEAMTTVGGPVEVLKASHSGRGTKLASESTDWVEGQLSVHEGKRGPVIWSDYEYKGFFGKRYGIRCTVNGPVRSCTLMLECGQSARDKWRPTLLAIAESIHYVGMKDGKEERDDLEIGPDLPP